MRYFRITLNLQEQNLVDWHFLMKVFYQKKNNLINKITIDKNKKPLDTPQKALTIQSDEILDLFGTQK
jgi:hypothetical protein